MHHNRSLLSCSFLFCAISLLSSTFWIGAKAFVVVGATEASSSRPPVAFANKRRNMVQNELTATELDRDTSEFYQYAASAVDLTFGQLSSQSVLSVVRSVRNWELNARQSYLYRFHLGADNTDNSLSLPPVPLDSSVQVYLPSPSGKKTLIIKTEKDETDERIVEVWQGASLQRRIKIGGKGAHGKVINDAVGFGVPTWSPDEECLLYSAERLAPTTVPFWTTEKESDDQHRGGQNVLGQGTSESWGETYSKQEAILDLYVLNLSTGRLGRVQNVPETFDQNESITLGQAVWHPNGSKIAFTGWSAGQPKRLGMVYCRNRASKIYETEVGLLLEDLSKDEGETSDENNSDYACVSEGLHYSRSPRYVQGDDEKTLVFLGSDVPFVSHDACMGLYRWDETKKDTTTIVPVVENPSSEGATVAGLGFPGLFLGQLPMDCNLGDNSLVTSTLWGSFQRVVKIDIQTGKVQLIEIPQLNELASQSLCAVGPNGDLIISQVSCDKPASLWVVKNSDLAAQEGDKIAVDAHRVASFSPIATSTFSAVEQSEEKAYTMQVLTMDANPVDGAESSPIQSLLLLPKNASSKEKVPMIVVPHGGPHSCSASAFSPGVAYLATKYAVLLPNYRGSIGFGQAPLKSLLTRIGRVDVEDLMLCTNYTVDNFPEIDGDRVGICGGSHGGFLTAHCTSQFPEFFKAAAMRNPVTNIASMVTSTDIPDWCYGEAMAEYDQSKFRGPNPDQLMKMYEKSPVRLVHQVKAPTLLALGLVDLRVPPSQGLEWFHSLKSLGVPTKLMKYPQDCHSLNLVTTEANHWMHIRHWFDKYL